jgi:hypothetical protein
MKCFNTKHRHQLAEYLESTDVEESLCLAPASLFGRGTGLTGQVYLVREKLTLAEAATKEMIVTVTWSSLRTVRTPNLRLWRPQQLRTGGRSHLLVRPCVGPMASYAQSRTRRIYQDQLIVGWGTTSPLKVLTLELSSDSPTNEEVVSHA